MLMSLLKKKFVFTIRFEMKKHKKEETMNPWFHWGGLDLQNRSNFSAFFGQTEASVKRPWNASHARKKEKKHEKKHRCPYAHKDRETTKNILRIVNS